MGIEQKIYTIADAHLDTSWVWTFETTVGEYIPRTFNENFELFKKYPEYKFNFEGSYRYELMKEYYPESFEKVKEYVKEGRWCPCGSCYENGDVNVPSPEALIRNIIYGNGFFRDNFGVDSNDIFLPDCFGFGKALPGVAAHCGLTGFSTQKLTWGCAVSIPFDVGKWTSLDGKYLWASIKPGNYTKVFEKVRTEREILNKLKENNEKYSFEATMAYHGVGDRGGAPKEKSVNTVCNEIRENDKENIKVLSSSTKEFFDDLCAMSEEQKNKMPVYDGEFLMTEHGAGSYTSRTVSKRWNRRSELLADAAERTAVSAYILGLSDYPLNVFDTAWKKTIAHQFHDDITGTSWMIDYKRNWNDYVQSMNLFSTEYTAAIKAITGAMDTSFVKGKAVAVSNTTQTSKTTHQAVTVEISEKDFPDNIRVFDANGNEVPSQIDRCDKPGFKKATFIAELPANSIKIYDIRKSSEAFAENTGLRMSGNTLENKNYIVTFDVNGDISSVFDKKIEKELLSAPIQLQLINDIEIYDYAAWEVKYKDIMRKPYACAVKPSFSVVNIGPALCALKIVRTADKSTFTQYVSMDAESDFIRVYNEVDWRSEASNLKVSFPCNAISPEASYDIGIGSYKRGTNTKERFEVPAQRWVDISNGIYGMSVLSDSRSGWDKPNDNTIRLTAIHTSVNNHNRLGGQNVADFGLNRFSFGIYGHSGDPEFAPCAADRFCQPMHAFFCDVHKGKMPAEFSLCSVSSDSVRILGIKKAQKSDEIVIRLCEYKGIEQKNVKVSFALPVKSASEITGDEQYIGKIESSDGLLSLDFGPNQIRSILVKLDGTKKFKKNTNSIELPYNIKGSSTNEDRIKAVLKGFTVPSELIQETLVAGGIEYKFKTEGKNVVICKGQKIDVPKDAKNIHFILTSVNGDRCSTFKADDNSYKHRIQDCFEAVGAWDLIGLGETGYIKKNPQIFTFTHTHSSNGDELAKQFYLFHISIPCDKCKEITLPDDENIIIFAASYDKSTNIAENADEHFDSLEKRKNDYVLSGYAKKLLRESKITNQLNDAITKVDNVQVNKYFTEERKDKVKTFLRDVKDKNNDGQKIARAKYLAFTRKIKNK